MAEDTRDTLMLMMLDGKALPAESTALIAADDDLAKPFQQTKVSKDTYSGTYFSVTDFRLEVGLLGDSSQEDPATTQAHQKRQTQIQQKQIDFLIQALQNAAVGKPPMAGRSFNDYPRFMQRGPAAMRQKAYSADLTPVTFTKNMDKSSLDLFKACVNFKVFDSATIIKRRGIGQSLLKTFLQIKFSDVLITDFDWQEDDVVKENVKFVCRKAEVTYAMQNDKGEFTTMPMQSWSLLNLKNT
jgi:type VI protein secretion system component Hcp